MKLQSNLTCPSCGYLARLEMPVEACQRFYQCARCGFWVRPKPGDCCVFCSFGDTPCPPKQFEQKGDPPIQL